MSYDILYRRLFINIGDAEQTGKQYFIPMIEAGSNNCYEVGRNGKCGRRSRDWQNSTWITRNTMSQTWITKDELEQRIDDFRTELIERHKDDTEDQYEDKRFGYFTAIRVRTGRTRFSTFKSFYMNGCTTALTVEELVAAGIIPEVRVYVYDEQKFFEKYELEVRCPKLCTTTEQLIATIKEWREYYSKTNTNPYITYNASEWRFENLLKEKNGKKNKREKELTSHFWYLTFDNNNYFVKKTAKAFHFAYYMCGQVKKFKTEKEANKYRDSKYFKDRLEVKEFNDVSARYYV